MYSVEENCVLNTQKVKLDLCIRWLLYMNSNLIQDLDIRPKPANVLKEIICLKKFSYSEMGNFFYVGTKEKARAENI